MKKMLNKLAVSAALIAALSGCMADEPFYSEGEGTLYLSTRINNDVEVRTRAEVSDLAASCDIWIASDKGIVRTYHGTDQVPSEGIKLVTGSYKALVWAGDSLPASWTDKFYKGTQPFTIEAGSNKAVDVTAKIVNSVVAVNFDPSVADVLSDYSLTVGHSQGKLTFDASTEAEARAYFMMNSRDKDLTWTLKGKRLDGSGYSRTGEIIGAKEATLYTLNVLCPEQSSEIGGAYLDITIDETTFDKEFDITVDAAPEIMGIDFDITKPQRATENNMGKRSVWIRTTSEVASLVLTCDYFEELLNIDGNDFDFFQMSDEGLKSLISQKGISYVYNQNEQDGDLMLPTIKLNFESTFTNNLPEGNYPILIEVTDSKGKRASATLRLVISDASLAAMPADENLVWATHATVPISVLKEGVENPVVKYRKKGTSVWENSVAPQTIDLSPGATMTAELTGLSAGTTYEYCAGDGDFESTVEEFTTETATQLPNSSFEDWQTSSAPYLIYAAGGSMFWDSGNHGSATLRKNVTVPTTSPVHSGQRAISLESQFVSLLGIGKFAAGNVFVGEYLGTDGTDGILGWGRPFTTRPKQLKVWAHYTPVTIDRNNADTPPPAGFEIGQPDRGTIYIALLDDHTESYNNKNYPVIIKTASASRRLFDPTGSDKPHVIAYGIHDFTEATPGSEMVQITVDLDYYREDLRPSYVLITASASKGGDYFAGGNGSKLVLDDIELVY